MADVVERVEDLYALDLADFADAAEASALEARSHADAAQPEVQQLCERLDELDDEHR